MSTYNLLIEKYLKAIASEVFKSLSNLNPNCMNNMFQVKYITHDLSDSNSLCQPKFNKITYDKHTVSYYETHIWNSLPNNIKQFTSLDNFKTMIKACEGPKFQCSSCIILYKFNIEKWLVANVLLFLM